METFQIAVVGGGGAGTMAYLRSVLNGDRTAFFLGNADTKRKGRAIWVQDVDNIPGMHGLQRPITNTTKDTLKWLKAHKEIGYHGEAFKASVTKIERRGELFVLHYEDKREACTLRARYVILATGIMDRQPEIQGSIKPVLPFANRGDFIYCVRCDGHRTLGKKLSIIGTSSTTMAIAAMMCERYGHEDISILCNGNDPEFTDKDLDLAKAYGASIHKAPITKLLGSARQEGLQGFQLEDGTVVETNCCIVSLGIIPTNQLLLSLGGDVDKQGKALVDANYETNIPNLFVVGDLVSGKKMQIYTAWDEAVDAADEINRRIRLKNRKEFLSPPQAST
ncbi:MAG TPA: NAD(P)/FAD-dependent oxidoreductase [Planctomycetes bacterium]|nr:NAD(P)/FAD-dependent oxidoreductase [Planctomycetota bacterium]